MRLCHDIPSAGHQGVTRSKERLRKNFYWWRMSGDIKDYVRTCDASNRNKKRSLPHRAPYKVYQAGSPTERVRLDFFGSLPRTEEGNEYILMMVDNFTKWVECVPLPSQTAEITARGGINEFFARFGYSYEIFYRPGEKFRKRIFS